MAIKKDWTEDSCTACGLCDEFCFEVAKLNNEATLNEVVNYAKNVIEKKKKAKKSRAEGIKIFE